MSDALENVTERATAKIGPLPAWGWGLIVAGVALVAYFVFGSRITGSSAAAGAVTEAADPEDTAIPVDSGSAAGGSTATSYDSNTSWLARAMSQVATKLGASPSDVYAALTEGLQGGTVTSKGKTFWDTALSDLGAPPEGVQGPVTVSDTVGSTSGLSSLDDYLSRQEAAQTAWLAQQEQARVEAEQRQAAWQQQQEAAAESQRQATEQAAESARVQAEQAAAAAQQAAASAASQSSPTAQQPAKTPSYSITNTPIGQKYTLQSPHKGYGSAADANTADTKKAKTTVNPGSYTVNDRKTLSKGVVVKLGNYWINV